MIKKLINKMKKYISILLLFLLLTSCGSDLDITKFTDKEISEKFSVTDNGLLYYKKDLYTGQIVKYNYVGGTLDFELNYIDGKYDGLQKSYNKGEIYKEMFFKNKTLESYSLYFPDGSKKEYLDSKGNVMILNNQKDTLNYLKINEDKTISYPIIYSESDSYDNQPYTINESVTKDSLIVYNDNETINFKNLKNIHQVYPINRKEIYDFNTPWEGYSNFLISDSIYHQEYNRSQKRVFLKLRNDPIINIFDTNLSSSFSLNTEIVSNMSNKFYREWGNHTLKSINGDSVKVRQMELSIDYNEKGLTDSLEIKDLKLHKLNKSNLFIYSDTTKSEYYKQYLVYPETITIRNGDSIQKFTYQFYDGDIYNKDYKGIHLSNINISSRIEFKPNGSGSRDIKLLNVSFRLDNVINNKVYRNDYFHFIDDIDKNKDLGVLTSILKKKLDDGEDDPDLGYSEKFLFSTYLSDGRGTKINNINDFKLTSISHINTSEGQFSAYDSYGSARKNYVKNVKIFIPEINKVVKYVNELKVKIPNTGLEFIKNNL
jgi:hypothetical protein